MDGIEGDENHQDDYNTSKTIYCVLMMMETLMMMMMMAVHLSSVIYVISRKLQKLGHFLSRAVATYYDSDDDDDDDHDHDGDGDGDDDEDEVHRNHHHHVICMYS